MADILRLYRDCGIDVPIRVDHVQEMTGDESGVPGYQAIGRLFAIGYLKGLMEMGCITKLDEGFSIEKE